MGMGNVLSLSSFQDDWPGSGYGIRSSGPVAMSGTQTETNAIPAPSNAASNLAKPWHPDSPLMWAGVLIGVTFGLIGFSTSTAVRVGKGKAGVDLNIGETK